jgi:hypothetical protein
LAGLISCLLPVTSGLGEANLQQLTALTTESPFWVIEPGGIIYELYTSNLFSTLFFSGCPCSTVKGPGL